MKILILANKVPYPLNDGGAIATFNMVRGLAEAGAQVSLLAMSTPKHPSTSVVFSQSFCEKVSIETVFVNTRISPINLLLNLFFRSKPYNAERFDNKDFGCSLEALLKNNAYDIVQLEGPYLHPYIQIIRKYFNGQIVLRAHNVEWEIWQRSSNNSKKFLKKWYFGLLAKRILKLEQQILKEINTLVPITARDLDQFISMGYTGNSFVCPTGFYFESIRGQKIIEDHDSLFHIGGLDWLPNRESILWFLDKCWDSIIASYPSVKFYIAGRNASSNFISRLERYKGVVFCGEVNDSSEFMKSKGVMVVPLQSGSGMRIKIVEAMALAKPIVCTSIAAEGIPVEQGKHLLIANSPQEFSGEVLRMLNSRLLRQSIGFEARQFAEKYLNNAMFTRKLLDFYQSTINQSSMMSNNINKDKV
jgi:polysaccharide biosynthesis protein PslH